MTLVEKLKKAVSKQPKKARSSTDSHADLRFVNPDEFKGGDA